MEICINDDELQLLSYLHENAMGYNCHPFYFNSWEVEPVLGWDHDQLNRVVSFLAGFRLVEIPKPDELGITQFIFTSQGEDYVRHVEVEGEEKQLLEKGKHISLEVLKGMGKGLREALVKVAGDALGAYVKTFGF